MISLDAHTKVYLAVGATDLRKQIDGLAALVIDVLHEDPFSSQVFCFCNRGRDKLKIWSITPTASGCGTGAWSGSASGGRRRTHPARSRSRCANCTGCSTGSIRSACRPTSAPIST